MFKLHMRRQQRIHSITYDRISCDSAYLPRTVHFECRPRLCPSTRWRCAGPTGELGRTLWWLWRAAAAPVRANQLPFTRVQISVRWRQGVVVLRVSTHDRCAPLPWLWNEPRWAPSSSLPRIYWRRPRTWKVIAKGWDKPIQGWCNAPILKPLVVCGLPLVVSRQSCCFLFFCLNQVK